MSKSKRQLYMERLKLMENEAEENGWRSHWQDVQSYLLPRGGQFLDASFDKHADNDGRRRDERILNSSSRQALNILVAGLSGGLTNPQTKWFEPTVDDQDLANYRPAKIWFEEVQKLMLKFYQQSNIYSVLRRIYEECGAFGVSGGFIDEDDEYMIRGKHIPVGSFFVEVGANDRPCSMFRKEFRTTRQLLEKFGPVNVSDKVLTARDKNRWGEKFLIVHVCERVLPDKVLQEESRGFNYRSVYFEYNLGKHEDKLLSDRGYHEQPFFVPRWTTRGSDPYGHGPGMEALGDIKGLQAMEFDHLHGIAFASRPPLAADAANKGQLLNLVPDGISYVAFNNGQPTVKQLYDTRPDLQGHLMSIGRVEERIKEAFYNPLFLAVLGKSKRYSATEIVEIHNERLALLGPIIEQFESELLNVMNNRAFSVLARNGHLPPPPQELLDQPIRVKFLGVLSQAMKLVHTTSIERSVGFIGTVAGIAPDSLDTLDADTTIREYVEMQGSPTVMLRDSMTVDMIRQGRAQDRAQQQQMEQAKQAADIGRQMAHIQKISGGQPGL